MELRSPKGLALWPALWSRVTQWTSSDSPVKTAARPGLSAGLIPPFTSEGTLSKSLNISGLTFSSLKGKVKVVGTVMILFNNSNYDRYQVNNIHHSDSTVTEHLLYSSHSAASYIKDFILSSQLLVNWLLSSSFFSDRETMV